jgi:hypothetical protein
MELFAALAISILLSVLVGNYAQRKGQPFLTYFLLSVVLTPVLGLLIAAVAETKVAGGALKKCPDCAELIKAEALVCRFCGCPLGHDEPPSAPAPAAPEQSAPGNSTVQPRDVELNTRFRWLMVGGAAFIVFLIVILVLIAQ